MAEPDNEESHWPYKDLASKVASTIAAVVNAEPNIEVRAALLAGCVVTANAALPAGSKFDIQWKDGRVTVLPEGNDS